MEINSAQTCEDLMTFLKKIKVSLATLAEPHNLTLMQLHVLYAINQGAVNMSRVAATLHCDASNITGIVDRLVSQHLITRTESTKDRRAKTLELTAKGQHIIDDVALKLPVKLGCTKLTGTERSALHEYLGKLTA